MNLLRFVTSKGRALAATLFVVAPIGATANAQGFGSPLVLSCVTPIGGGPLAFTAGETVKAVWKSNTGQNICVTVSAADGELSFVIGPGGLSASVKSAVSPSNPAASFPDSKTICSLAGTATQVNVSRPAAAAATVQSGSYVICKN